MKIYDINNAELLDVSVTENAVHEEELMKSDFVKLSWNDTEWYVLPADAYVMPFDDGVKYSLFEPYSPEQKSEAEWHYEPSFMHPKMYISKVPFTRDSRDSDGNEITLLEWSYTGYVETLLSYFCERINNVFNRSDSQANAFNAIMQGVTNDIVSISFDAVDIMSALNSLAGQLECEWHLDWSTNFLYFGHIEINTDERKVLEVGKNIGVPSLRSSKEGFWNTFLAQGGTRNISRRAASGEHVQANVRLSLDKDVAYPLNQDDYPNGITLPDGVIYTDNEGRIVPSLSEGVRRYEKTVIFENIYPKLDLFVYDVRSRERYLMEEDSEGRKKFVVDYYDTDGKPVYKRYSVWFFRLAYPTYADASKRNVLSWSDFELTNNVEVSYASHYVKRMSDGKVYLLLKTSEDFTSSTIDFIGVSCTVEIDGNIFQSSHVQRNDIDKKLMITLGMGFDTEEALLADSTIQAALAALQDDEPIVITGDAASLFPQSMRHSIIIDGMSPIAAFQPNLREGAYDCPLAGRGGGDGSGHYGFKIAYHTEDEVISSGTDDDIDTGVTIRKGDYEIIMEQSDTLILPTTQKMGIIPKGYPSTDLNALSDKRAPLVSNIVNMYNIVAGTELETSAKYELAAETKHYIEELFRNTNTYSFKSYPTAFYDEYKESAAHQKLSIGQAVTLKNGDFELDTRVMKLVTHIDIEYEQEITVGNAVLKGGTQQLREKVETLITAGASNGSAGGTTSLSAILSILRTYGGSFFLSKLYNDTAEGVITFANGLISKGLAWFKENVKIDGLLTAYNAVMNNIHSSNFTGHGLADTGWSITNDYNGHSKLTIDELYVRMKAVFESLEVRERTYTGGDQIFSCAGNYVNRTDYLSEEEGEEVEVDDKGAPKKALGYSDIKVPFTLRSLLSALVGRKPLATKRRVRFHFAPQSTGADEVIRSIRRVRCYFLAKDDDREIHNWWQLNDLARCQTMNLANVNRETYLGEDHKIGNVFWWRKVIAVSSTPCTLSDGKQYHWFDVAYNHDIEQSDDPAERAAAATFAMLGSDIPAAGDSVVQFGNTTQEGRMNLIMIEVNGGTSDDGYSAATEAPSIKAYRGIYCFDLTKCWVGGSPRKMMLSPKSGYEFYGPYFKQATEYDVVPVPVERGLWTGIDFERDDYDRDEKPDYSDDATSQRHGDKRLVRKCYYFDKVSHNGRYWLCSIVDGAHWRAEVDFGDYKEGDLVTDQAYDALGVEDKQKCERRQNYTVDEPSENSIDWQMVVDRGADGASAWVADLDNDMSSVALDSSNQPSATQEVTANVLLFYGVVAKTPVITSIVRHYGSGSTRTWTTGSNTRYEGVKVNWSGAAITITYTTSATIIDRDDFTINFRDSVDTTVTRSLTLSVAGIRGDARFELIPSASSIVKSEDGTHTPSTLSCNLTKYDVRKGQYITPAASEYAMSYIADGGSDIVPYTANTPLTPGTDFAKSITFRLTVGGVIVDRETINIVEDGSDGENTVQLILDNQHEDFLYSDTGLVSPSGGATSPVHLYDGETDKTTQATFRVFDDYTQTWVTSTGSSASAAASVTVNNGVVTLSVTALRSDSAKVRVRAEYPASSWKYFYAEFTANKVKQDKYDLILNPSSIAYNSASYSPVTIAASAKRIDLQGNQSSPAINTTANSGNLRLFKGFVNSAGTVQSLTRQTAASYRVTAQNCEDYIGIYFELRWYYDSSTSDSSDQTTYRLCDYETVEIAKAENGTNGNDAHEVNPNILLRTIFDQGIDSVKGKWFKRLSWENIFVDTANDTIVLGRKSIRIVAPLDDYEDLTQHVYEYNVHQGVKTNTWYTLSFYSFSGKQQSSTSEEKYFLHTYVYPESTSACIDISQVYVDGVQKTLTSNDGKVEWANAWTGARHTFTFKTLSSFPTDYVDVKFRVLAGGIGCICMPKLEEGMVATAYQPNEDDLIGADGESGVNVVATPSAIIVNQDVTNTNNLSNLSSDTAARCVFSIMKGTQQLTVSAVSVSSTSHCAAQGGSRNYVQLTSITQSSGKYYDSGYVICSLTYNDGGTNRTITNVRVNFYANLLGTWAVETTAAATTAAGEKIETELGPNGAITTQYTAAIKANAKELRSEYTEQISRAGDYNRNLFGYNRGITLGRSSGELPIPFIQGYGLILRGLQDGVTGGRLYNLKLDGVGGPFVITCQMRLSASSSGEKVFMELCDKVNTRGEGSVPADSDYVGISDTWTNYEFHLDITDERAVHADLDGYLDIQGNWSGAPYIYIRHLKIERGTKATDWCEADEDIAYLGHGQMITALTANSKDNQGTTISGTSITQTTFTINDSQKAGYAISVNLSNLASGRYITFLEQSAAFTLTAGKIYTLSYWAKGTAGIVLKNYLYKGGATIITSIGYNVYDPGGNGTIVEGVTANGETSIRLNNEWLYYCIHFYVANSVTGAAVIPLRLVKSDNSSYSGTAYINIADIQLQEGYVVSETYFRSMIEQNARRISLVQQTGSRLAGIDIENGIINLKGDRVTFSNGDGTIKDKVAIDPETGTLYAVDGEFSGNIRVKKIISTIKTLTIPSNKVGGTYEVEDDDVGNVTIISDVNSNTIVNLRNLEIGENEGREFTFMRHGGSNIRLQTGNGMFYGVQYTTSGISQQYSGNIIYLPYESPVRLQYVQGNWYIVWGYYTT